MHPRHLYLLGPVVAPALFGCAGEASGGGPARGRANGADRVVPVAVAPVARRDVSRRVTLTGPVEPIRAIGVNSQISGSVRSIAVVEGDRVAAGRVLARLDDREATAQLRRAEAVLARAEGAFQRASQLHAGDMVTDVELEEARAAFEVARSDVALWRTRVDLTRIAAPTDAIVTAKHVEAGSGVSPNQRLFDLADVSQLVVRVQVSELDVVHLRRGAGAELELDAYPGVGIPGTIRRIFPSADPVTRLVPVEVALGPHPDTVIVRPGFFARVTLRLNERANALMIPAPAVAVTEDAPFVYVVQADTLVRRSVELGATTAGFIEVLYGLDEGELVVISGLTSLRPGLRVQPSRDVGG